MLEAKADELYSYTLGAIGDYRSAIEAIKVVLLERYVLSKDEVFALLEQHFQPLLPQLQAA